MELKDIEWKNKEDELKKKIEELLYRPIIKSKDDIGKSEEKKIKKIRLIKK